MRFQNSCVINVAFCVMFFCNAIFNQFMIVYWILCVIPKFPCSHLTSVGLWQSNSKNEFIFIYCTESNYVHVVVDWYHMAGNNGAKTNSTSSCLHTYPRTCVCITPSINDDIRRIQQVKLPANPCIEFRRTTEWQVRNVSQNENRRKDQMAHLYLGDTMQTLSHKPTRVLETKSKLMGFLFYPGHMPGIELEKVNDDGTARLHACLE